MPPSGRAIGRRGAGPPEDRRTGTVRRCESRNWKLSTTIFSLDRFLPVLRGPLIQPQWPSMNAWLPLRRYCLDQVGQLADLAAVERLDVEEDRLVFPLSRLRVLACGC